MQWVIDHIEILTLGLFLISWLIRMLYVLGCYRLPLRRISQKADTQPSSDFPPVSVIVIALNRETSFIRNVKKILAQQYPRFEVIVVIDNADKDVEDELKLLMHSDNRIRYTFVPNGAKNISKRKLALTIAAKSARYDWILQTENYCYPSSPAWISRMINARTPETGIVLGGNVTEALPIGLKRYMAYNDLVHSLQMLYCGIRHIPYVGDASNLLIKKDLLFSHIHFGKSLKEEWGEDHILVNSAASKTNVNAELTPDSVTISNQLDKRDWLKRNHSIKKFRSEIKGKGRTIWKINTLTSALYYIFLIIALLPNYNFIPILLAITALHIIYRISFWSILYLYSKKTASQRFWFLPFYAHFLSPFIRYKDDRFIGKKRH
ncbi:MAG: glycosyltransferase [Bacteroidales bacterium]|nr:glycosyltransferase [Bacteroidales bacterium]